MKFSQDFIERVRNAHNIVEFISQHTVLKRSGAQYMGLCPFPSHKEKSPSFSVSEDRQVYHCFGCNKGGNLITFLEEFQGLSFPQAIEFLANKAGIPLPTQTSPEQTNFNNQKTETFKVNSFVEKLYVEQWKKLPETSPAKTYLQKRGLSAEVIASFHIGWSPDSWNFVVQSLTDKKVPMRIADTAGVVRRKASANETRYYDYFRGRIIFPIISPSNDVLGFGGRCLGDETPKYLNSPDTPVFNKGKVLFGLNESGKFIRAEDQVIVVEGYMDFLALFQAGFKNVVAVLGTALTPDHCKILQRFTKNVVVLFDGDSAGIRAAERSLPILLASDLLPKWALLPEKLDPDEFVKKYGPQKFKETLQNAEEMFVGLLGYWMKGFSNQNFEKLAIIEKVAPILQDTKNNSLKELYLNELLIRLRVDKPWLLNALNSFKQTNTEKVNPSTPTEDSSQREKLVEKAVAKIRLARLSRAELDLLGLALKNKTYLETLSAADFLQEASADFAQLISQAKNHLVNFPDDFNKLAGYISTMVDTPSIVTKYVNSALQMTDAKMEQKLLNDCINWIRSQKYKEKQKEMLYKLRSQHSQQDLEQFMNITKKKHGILDT